MHTMSTSRAITPSPAPGAPCIRGSDSGRRRGEHTRPPSPGTAMATPTLSPRPRQVSSLARYRCTVPEADEVAVAEDARVAAAWASGHDRALAMAWERFGGLVFTYCQRSLGDRDRAADCTQETFVGAWRSRDRYDPSKGSLAGWLVGIARYKVLDAHRAAPRVPVPMAEPPEGDGAGDTGDELADRLLVTHALRDLPDRSRQVIELAFWSELSQSEIATRLGVPLGTVKSDMRRGLQRLRAHLEGGGTGERNR